ncbi:MAG TPA: arginase family protein [Bacteriovoracaceae bacterium]|nr:arginase family protein [Bacteriovoracaceae bacterium]
MKLIPLLMTLPGDGVHTIHTAKEKKAKLFKAYYGTPKMETAHAKWVKSLTKMDARKPWVFGIPSDNGGGIQRGANWGPLALRQELLDVKNTFHDLGDVRVIPHLLHDKYLNEATIKLCQKALYGKINKLPVSPLSIAEKALSEVYKAHPDVRIFGMGGDHSTSYPLVMAWLKSRKNLSRAGVLHFDAHTDLLPTRLGIDICFGTWTYQILESLKSPGHIIQVGIRSSGKDKKHWKKELGVEQIWASDMKKDGVAKILKKIVKQYKDLGITELYISFDIDALDEKFAAATGTPEKDGLLPSDCAALIRLLAQEIKITGADLMEVAPFVLPEGIELRDQQSSLTVAGDMAKVLLETLQT